jgi:hypothetical protein
MKVRSLRSPLLEGIRMDEELVLKTSSGGNSVVSSSLTPSAIGGKVNCDQTPE